MIILLATVLLLFSIFIVYLIPSNKECSVESFTAGLEAVNDVCINNCTQNCIDSYPVWLRGPINSGAYTCSRLCSRYCNCREN